MHLRESIGFTDPDKWYTALHEIPISDKRWSLEGDTAIPMTGVPID
jgi:hypothetical protein